MTNDFVTEVFKEYGKELHAFLARLLRNKEDAKDAAQEVFDRLRALPRSDLVREPQNYAYRVARQVAGEMALRKRADLVVCDSDLVQRHEDDPAKMTQPDFAKSVMDEQELKRALASLHKTLRQVLEHKAFGYSNGEIAKALGLSRHTVKKYLDRARHKVRAKKREDT